MQTIEMDARTKNVAQVNGRPRARCHFCGDTGYVVAVIRREEVREFTRTVGDKRVRVCCAGLASKGGIAVVGHADYEEMGPCPFCERGFYEEFGDAESQTKSPPVRPPWNMKDGFWKGRDLVELVPLEQPEGARLSLVESGERAQVVLDRLTRGSVLEMPRDHAATYPPPEGDEAS